MKFQCRLLLSLLILVLAASVPSTLQAQGIDVSKFQGTINWKKVANSKKVKFVYIRATEGTSIKDPNYRANVDSARKHNIYVGSYHVYSSKTSAYTQFANQPIQEGVVKRGLVIEPADTVPTPPPAIGVR